MDKSSSIDTVWTILWAVAAQFLVIYFEVGCLTLIRKRASTWAPKILFIGIAAALSFFWVLSWWSMSTYGGFWGPLMVANALSLDSQATLHLNSRDALVVAQLVGTVVLVTAGIAVICGKLAQRLPSASLIKLSILHIAPVIASLSLFPDSPVLFKDLTTASGGFSPEVNVVREIRYLRRAAQQQKQLNSPPLETIDDWARSLAAPKSPRADVVVILFEALRADALSKQRTPETIIPNVHALAQSGTLFTRAFAGAPDTGLAIETLLGGTYPYHGPLRHHISAGASPRIPLLYDLLIRAGYRVGHFSSTDWSSTRNFVTRNENVRYQASDKSTLLDDKPSGWIDELARLLKESPPGLFAQLDETTVRNFESWQHAHTHQPTFSFVYLISSHFPWSVAEPGSSNQPASLRTTSSSPPPISALSPNKAGDYSVLRAQYDRALHQADRFVGQILETVRQRRRDRPVVVLLLGDHGEAFGEHGAFLHSSSLYDEQIRIPIIVSKGDDSSQISNEVVSQVDVAPSILTMTNLPSFNGFQGSDVLASQHTRPAPPNPVFLTLHSYKPLLGVVLWPYKAIFNSVHDELQLFNLESDPSETRDIAPQTPMLAKTFLELMTSFREEQPAYHASPYLQSPMLAPPHYTPIDLD